MCSNNEPVGIGIQRRNGHDITAVSLTHALHRLGVRRGLSSIGAAIGAAVGSRRRGSGGRDGGSLLLLLLLLLLLGGRVGG